MAHASMDCDCITELNDVAIHFKQINIHFWKGWIRISNFEAVVFTAPVSTDVNFGQKTEF